MNVKTKSIIIGRKKREHKTDEDHPCFIACYSINNPHTSGKVPTRIEEFPHTHKVVITGLDLSYLLAGNDIVINDLEEVEIEAIEGHVYIRGKQLKR